MSFFDDLLDFIRQINASGTSFVDEMVVQPIEDILNDIQIANEALQIIADAIPDPPESSKTKVVRLYDVQKLLVDVRRDKLRNLVHDRNVKAKLALQTAFNSEARSLIFRFLIRLKWLRIAEYMIKNLGKITVATLGAQELYTLLKIELQEPIAKLALGQDNERHRVTGPHYTRKV